MLSRRPVLGRPTSGHVRIVPTATAGIAGRAGRLWSSPIAWFHFDRLTERSSHSAKDFPSPKLQTHELSHLRGDRQLGRKSFHRAGSIEAIDCRHTLHDILSVGGRRDRPTMAKCQHVRLRTVLAASAIAVTSRTQSSRALAVLAPMEPVVVSPMWATTMSAPAAASNRACSGSNAYGVVNKIQLVRRGDAVDLVRKAHTGFFEIRCAGHRRSVPPSGSSECPRIPCL